MESTMRETIRERGEGRLGTVIALALLAVFGLALWNVGPVYVADYSLGDHIVQTARRPVHIKDDAIRDLLMEEVRSQGLRDLIKPTDFKIQRRDGSRKIELKYQRTVEVLPSWKHTFAFEHGVDEIIF
jgi:hypothetical protein